MTFLQAITKCYRKYGSFRGRAGKREYLWFSLLAFLFEWPLLLTTFQDDWLNKALNFVYFALTISVIVPHAAVWTRRMHDQGKSGWRWIITLIPIIGWILYWRWVTRDGDPGTNKHGLPDDEPYTSDEVAESARRRPALNAEPDQAAAESVVS